MDIQLLCDKISQLYGLYLNEEIIVISENYKIALRHLLELLCQEFIERDLILGFYLL